MSTNASDGVSFEALFESELSYVCRTLRRLGVKEADLDDLAQEVFITVHRHLHEYDSSRPLKPWLFSFAFGTAANYRRLARHRAEKHEDSDVHASTAPGTSWPPAVSRMSCAQRRLAQSATPMSQPRSKR